MELVSFMSEVVALNIMGQSFFYARCSDCGGLCRPHLTADRAERDEGCDEHRERSERREN